MTFATGATGLEPATSGVTRLDAKYKVIVVDGDSEREGDDSD